MTARLRSWWQEHSKSLIVSAITVVVVGVLALIILGYLLKLAWTGFPTKTLWDWLNLLGVLAIPVVVGFGVVWFTHVQQQRDQQLAEKRTQDEREAAEKRAQTERKIAEDNQHEAALQEYINSMSELLLHEGLRDSKEDAEVRKIARVRTLRVLPRLDPERKASALQFLHESNLITRDKSIVDLNSADFSYVKLKPFYQRSNKLYPPDLSDINLRGADLSQAQLEMANLSNADLRGANLRNTTLSKASLRGSILVGAIFNDHTNMSEVDLRYVDLNGINVEKPKGKGASLTGTTLPDGLKHP